MNESVRKIRNYILNHFIDNNFFGNKQFVILKGWSTVLQLLYIMDKWTEFQFQEGSHTSFYWKNENENGFN